MMMIKLTIFGHHKVATYLKVCTGPSARSIHFNINRLNIWIDLLCNVR